MITVRMIQYLPPGLLPSTNSINHCSYVASAFRTIQSPTILSFQSFTN
ncbi:hypothetical protein LINGRAHAP2_LOCUS16392 [Linum grandiflorum]